jgi:hypothetical protein
MSAMGPVAVVRRADSKGQESGTLHQDLICQRPNVSLKNEIKLSSFGVILASGRCIT